VDQGVGHDELVGRILVKPRGLQTSDLLRDGRGDRQDGEFGRQSQPEELLRSPTTLALPFNAPCQVLG
jgi:hypothetical protein